MATWLYTGTIKLSEVQDTEVHRVVRLCHAYEAASSLDFSSSFHDVVIDEIVSALTGGTDIAQSQVPRAEALGALLDAIDHGSPAGQFVIDWLVHMQPLLAGVYEAGPGNLGQKLTNEDFRRDLCNELVAHKLGYGDRPGWERDGCAYHVHGYVGSRACYKSSRSS